MCGWVPGGGGGGSFGTSECDVLRINADADEDDFCALLPDMMCTRKECTTVNIDDNNSGGVLNNRRMKHTSRSTVVL
jgi:hypothetical protein